MKNDQLINKISYGTVYFSQIEILVGTRSCEFRYVYIAKVCVGTNTINAVKCYKVMYIFSIIAVILLLLLIMIAMIIIVYFFNSFF